MSHPPRRLARAVAAALVAAAAGVTLPAPARAAGTTGYCPDATGVTVVVDFNDLGGGEVIRCAPGEQASGLTALKNAGFTVTGTSRWGDAFVCRIDGKPTAAADPCFSTPPVTAYWSYWHATNGGSWITSSEGAGDRTPPQGSFEGWSFSTNHPDGAAPRPGAAPSRPAPLVPPPATTGPPRPVPTTARTTAGARTVAPEATTPPATGSAPATTPGDTAASWSADPAAAAAAEPSATAQPVDLSAARSESGVPVGTLAGVALLVVLAAAAGFAVRRRRSAGDG